MNLRFDLIIYFRTLLRRGKTSLSGGGQTSPSWHVLCFAGGTQLSGGRTWKKGLGAKSHQSISEARSKLVVTTSHHHHACRSILFQCPKKETFYFMRCIFRCFAWKVARRLKSAKRIFFPSFLAMLYMKRLDREWTIDWRMAGEKFCAFYPTFTISVHTRSRACFLPLTSCFFLCPSLQVCFLIHFSSSRERSR